MKLIQILIAALVAFQLNAAEIVFCDNPFPRNLYTEARNQFVEMLKKMGGTGEAAAVTKLSDLILQGFDPDRATALGDSTTRKRIAKEKFGRLELTAAHVAAMMQDVPALKWLIEHEADVQAKDKRGFTPAHFAALGPSRACLDFLLTNTTLRSRNEFGATAEDVWSLTHVPSLSRPVYFKDLVSNDIIKEDVNIFCLLTGVYFADGIKQTPESVLNTWFEQFQAREKAEASVLTSRVSTFIPRAFALYLRNLRPLSLHVQERLTAKDFRLHANHDFEAGDIVEVHAGLWDPVKNSVLHNYHELKTDQLAGYLPFAYEGGLPNVALAPFFNRLGVSQGHFAIAIRPIKRHDPIVRERLTYEALPKENPEHNADALDEILKATSLTTLPRSLNQGPFDVADIRNRALIRYIGDNPHVLIRLLAEQKITTAELKQFAEASSLRISKFEFGTTINVLDDVLAACDKLFTKLHVRRFFAIKAGKGKMHEILRMLEIMPELPETTKRSDLEELWSTTARLENFNSKLTR